MEALVKCPWCSKKVAISDKGCLMSHLNGGGIKCVGVGVNINQISELSEEVKKSKLK